MLTCMTTSVWTFTAICVIYVLVAFVQSTVFSRLGIFDFIIGLYLLSLQVRSSVASDAGSMMELQQWNEQYGEGGTRKRTTLSYYM